ncbi:MAG TPA: HD domain-containing protein [Candidatus Moranbacteria bacterium]|nr:HD domain-containing protein [Candidatus Moranbacteria bacterium]
MKNGETIEKTIKFAKVKMKNRESGHDWQHTERVRKVALKIAREEKADLFIVEMAALLHDVFDFKFFDENKAKEKIEKYLKQFKLDKRTDEHIKSIIANISFKGAKVENKISTLEGKIVQDADRLDAIGAIGIARVFSYGGHAGRDMYDPKIKPVMHTTFEKYKNGKSTSINHFYEKLLLLKNRMNTKTAEKMATERHNFMKKYLDQFYKEWEGKL